MKHLIQLWSSACIHVLALGKYVTHLECSKGHLSEYGDFDGLLGGFIIYTLRCHTTMLIHKLWG